LSSFVYALSLANKLAEGADHLGVDALGLDPNPLNALLELQSCLLASRLELLGVHLGTLGACFVHHCHVLVLGQLPLRLFHLRDDGHILLNKLFLGASSRRDKPLLPVLNLCLLVHGGHELLLYGEVINVLFFERLDKQLDTLLAVLCLYHRDQVALHQVLEFALQLPRA